jgi:hypothetical protein
MTDARADSLIDRPAGYDARIRTPSWLDFCRKLRRFRANRCALCNGAGRLTVHHRTWERWGREEPTDVLPLCRECHRFADRARQEAKS